MSFIKCNWETPVDSNALKKFMFKLKRLKWGLKSWNNPSL